MAGFLGEYSVRMALLECLAHEVTGLAAQVSAANNALEAAGRELRLPDPGELGLRAQLAQHPSHITLPAIHLVPGSASLTGRGASSGAGALDGRVSVDVGLYLLSPGAPDGLDEEGALIAMAAAYRELVRATLVRRGAQGGALGVGGISRIAQAGTGQELFQVNYKNGVIGGVKEILRLAVDYEVRA